MTKKVTTPEVTEQTTAESTQQMSDIDVATERRLVALYTLQLVDSEIDKIKIIRGELPQAIQDLEDEIAGLQTRISNFKENIAEQNANIAKRNNDIADHQAMIKKYEKQQDNVRNNREFEAINKEIEFQNLEIQLCERRNRDSNNKIKELEQHIQAAELLIKKCQAELDSKKASSKKPRKTRSASSTNPPNRRNTSTSTTSTPTSASANKPATALP